MAIKGSVTAGTKLGGAKRKGSGGLKLHTDMKDMHGGKHYGKAKTASRKKV